MKRTSEGGLLLWNRTDQTLGNAYLVMPEWNIQDITAPGSDRFLDLLKYRATTRLIRQYKDITRHNEGDLKFIVERMLHDGLEMPYEFGPLEWTFFLGNEMHGTNCIFESQEELMEFDEAIQFQTLIPRAQGELVALRECTMLSVLTSLMAEVLELDEDSKVPKTARKPDRPGAKVSESGAIEALSKLEISAPLKKLELPDLTITAVQQRESLVIHVDLLATEPLCLLYNLSEWHASQPGLVRDERGRQIPCALDKDISRSFLDMAYNAAQAVAIWDYLGRLLELLQSQQSDKLYRALILQEISNVCNLEYCRVQAHLKRLLQMYTASKWFRRIGNSQDSNDRPRVTMRGNPETLTRSDPQLHYLLQLCRSQTNSAQASEWLKKLGDLYAKHPLEREKLSASEYDTICDLGAIVSFIQDLGPIIAIPSFSRKTGQAFVARSNQLCSEIDQLRDKIDLIDYVAPIDCVLDDGAQKAAWKAFDEFVTEQTGTTLGYLYEDLVEECLVSLQAQYEQMINLAKEINNESIVPVFDVPEPPPQKERIKQRKQKEKTRPVTTSAYGIDAPQEVSSVATAAATTAKDIVSNPETFKVRASTAEVFASLFPKSGVRNPITWDAFVAAMTNVGFAVMPKFGSVYTFFPSESMAVQRPLTVHRPHGSQVEGYKLLSFARRLKKLYGWSEETFEVA